AFGIMRDQLVGLGLERRRGLPLRIAPEGIGDRLVGLGHNAAGNSKSQIPNPKKIPISKFQQCSSRTAFFWEAGAWNLFGFWILDFGFFTDHILPSRNRTNPKGSPRRS